MAEVGEDAVFRDKREAIARIFDRLDPGICAVRADDLEIRESIDSVHLKGTVPLVPLAACSSLLVLAGERGHLVPLASAGVAIAPSPAIGFRAAGFADVVLDCSVKKYAIVAADRPEVPGAATYLAVALGAGDYLSKRIKEHAVGRVQFPGQMLDTEGRDGIAKLGAVKAMIARTEAWCLLLETLYESFSSSSLVPHPSPHELHVLSSTLAALAFSPEPGSMGYDAGQVFGAQGHSGYGNFPNVIRLMAAKRIDMTQIITSRFPLDQGPQAVERASKRMDGKVMVRA